jgi:hypothetical protein
MLSDFRIFSTLANVIDPLITMLEELHRTRSTLLPFDPDTDILTNSHLSEHSPESQLHSSQNDGIFLLVGNYVHLKALDADFDTNDLLDADFDTNDHYYAKHRRLRTMFNAKHLRQPMMFSFKMACVRLELKFQHPLLKQCFQHH